MYAIENDLGRFQADTEKEAKKLLRKAQAEFRKREAEESAIRAVAHLRAQAVGYSIYERRGRGEDMPRGWRCMIVNSQSYCVREFYDVERGQRGYEIETNEGRAKVYPYDAITHYIENGAGFCMAIAIDKQDCELFAVGVNEERAAWVPLYGVKKSEFRTA